MSGTKLPGEETLAPTRRITIQSLDLFSHRRAMRTAGVYERQEFVSRIATPQKEPERGSKPRVRLDTALHFVHDRLWIVLL